MTKPGFKLEFDGTPSRRYPHGYWYASTSDGNYDADGATIHNALANLVVELHQAILRRDEGVVLNDH